MLSKSPISNHLLWFFLCQNTPSLHDWTKRLMAFSFVKQVSNQMEILTKCKFALLILAKFRQRPNPS